jgi:hypothetical protein
LILLPLRIFWVYAFAFFPLGIRFSRKLSILIIRIFTAVVFFFVVLLFLLISIAIVLTLFIIDAILFEVFIAWISVDLLLLM